MLGDAMHAFDYTFEFGDIGAKETLVHITNHLDGQRFDVRTQIDERNAFKAVRRAPLDVECVSDLFTLATIAHVVDRMTVRHGDELCRIRIVASAWRPGVLASPKVSRRLREILSYYTGDIWHFDWRQRERNSQQPQPQYQADWKEPVEIGLWSGGMDSEAGLISRFIEGSAPRYLAVGTGANDSILGAQRQTFREVSRFASGRVQLLQVPVHIVNNSHLPRDSSGRARGFVFILIGGACAYLQNHTRLHIYENGVGAINLPYRAAEVGLDHSRSVHPAALHQMGELLSLLVGESFTIHNPFLFTTKAELCRSFISLAESPWLADCIWKTVSCDSPHRQANLPSQCGYCTSCVLRRQALAVNGIEDLTEYAIYRKASESSFAQPLRMMRHQVETMTSCFGQSDPWRAFRDCFPDVSSVFTPEIVAQAGSRAVVRESVLELYRNYSAEWASLPNNIAPWFEWQSLAA